jgi:DNA (cytosine-5)-methyltransferase 1
MKQRTLPLISLFSGALGLDLGLERAGFNVCVAVEPNPFAVRTIKKNHPSLPVIAKRIEDVTTAEILNAAGLKVGEPAMVSGGLCCQAFSTAGQRRSINDPRGALFREFLRVVREARPRFFVMENVKGILSAAVRHRPLKERGPGCPPLSADEELGSGFRMILEQLRATGYYTVFDLLNAADFGVPQRRERMVFVGSRDGEAFEMPAPTHAANPTPGLKPWVTLREAISDLVCSKQDFTPFCPSKAKYIGYVPEGGNWHDIPKDLQKEALGAAHRSWGGRVGFFRRLSWDKPAPTLPTRPDSKATMLCHPAGRRPLSVQEYARIQQFPDSWQIEGGLPQKYKQIGNAVPVGLGEAIGAAIRKTMRRHSRVKGGAIVCADEQLLGRIAERPLTILNPRRMRKRKSLAAAKAWLSGKPNNRKALAGLISTGR